MARLNIEDSLFTDDKFIELCVLFNSEIKAIGWWVKIARLAQSYWKNDKGLIPEKAYKWSKAPIQLIESGIVKKRGNSYYFHGSEQNFAWIYSKVQNGRRGGVASKPIETKEIRGKRNGSETEATGKPLTLTPTPTLTPTLKKKTKEKKIKFDFEILYKLYPKNAKKSRGITACIKRIKTIKDYEEISQSVANYAEHCKVKNKDTQFCSDFVNFVKNDDWKDWIKPEEDELRGIPKEFEYPFANDPPTTTLYCVED